MCRERDVKRSKEEDYRALLRQQMLEKQAEKEAEKKKKKDQQEAELKELLEFEAKHGKKIAHEKKVLAFGEFGGQAVKGMLYAEKEGEGEKLRGQPPNHQHEQLQQPETISPEEANSIAGSADGVGGGIMSLLNRPQNNNMAAGMENDDDYLDPPREIRNDDNNNYNQISNVGVNDQNNSFIPGLGQSKFERPPPHAVSTVANGTKF